MDRYQRQWQKKTSNFAFELRASHVSLPQDSDDFAADYDYPKLSVGLKYSLNHGVTMFETPKTAWGVKHDVDYESRMGNVLSLSGIFERPFFRTYKWAAYYEFSFGVAYSHSKYDAAHNINNELIGSRWLIYFGAGAYATYHLDKDFAIKAGVAYYHYSNGALNRPNKGANFVSPVIGVVYEPYYEDLVKKNYKPKKLKPYWYLNFAAGVGGKTLDEDWKRSLVASDENAEKYAGHNFHFYMAYSFSADVMYRYARRWASGIGADFFYGTYANHVRNLDEADGRDMKHSPFSFGLSAKHEVFYHDLSLAVSLGWYLYRHMGYGSKQIETPYYERIGLRYSFPKLYGLQVGIDVKAHKTKADLTELVVAMPVRL